MHLVYKKTVFAGSVLFVLFVVFSGFFLPDANTIHAEATLQSPSLSHPFGTDQFGRDVFLRTVHGFRYTFCLALIIIAVSFPLGLGFGLVVGYYGCIIDDFFYHLSNIILSFPIIILALLIAALTDSNMGYLLLLIIIGMIITVSKIVRSEVLIIKHAAYIRNLRILGASDFRIISCHLALKAFRLLLPLAALFTGHIIISISTFSFLGFGIQPPQPEIGTMLHESLRFISLAPYLMFLPGGFQFCMVLLLVHLSKYAKKSIAKNYRKE